MLVASLAALVVPAALSYGHGHWGKTGKVRAPDEIYNVVSVTGVTKTSVSFDIMSTAIKGKEGKVAIMNATAPRPGMYYFTNDTAVIPFGSKADKKRQKPVMVDYNNTTMSVAGASAVVAMKNITMTDKGKRSCEVRFTDLGVYLPDGAMKSYKLTAPARIMKSADNSSMMIVGNPSLRAAMQDALMSGAKFPADARSVTLRAIDAK